METKLIKSQKLVNGLTLEIWDASRKVAADRWLVKLIAQMEIEVSGRWFGDRIQPPAEIERLHSELGGVKRFEYQTERNFIDAGDRQMIFDNMLDSIESKIPYYSHPDFAARFLIKEYAASQVWSNPI